MKWESETYQQHFLPQVEQRLNAANPQANPKNQRIYSFEVVNRETCELRLVNLSGQPISNNLALTDLFSFDVSPDKVLRRNFENAFTRYESEVKKNTENLLHKLKTGQQDVSHEVVNLLTPKLLNFIRNPFSISKVLNSFGTFTNYVPTAPENKISFERVLNGRKPHQAHLCKELCITDAEYETWLRLLFMMFIPSGDGDMNMLEGIVKSMFTTTHEISVLVGIYNDASCLLCDRAFSTNTDRQGVASFDFNLCSKAFIRYLFADIEAIAPPNTPPSIIENYKNKLKKLPRPIPLQYCVDNMELLAGFNRNVVYQSYRHVYCSSKAQIVL